MARPSLVPLALLMSLCLVPLVGASDDALSPLPEQDFTLAHARHLLFRAGFGGSPEEVQRLHRLGLRGMVQRLVHYRDTPDVVGEIEVPAPDRAAFRRCAASTRTGRRKLRNELRRADQREFTKLRNWWVERMPPHESPARRAHDAVLARSLHVESSATSGTRITCTCTEPDAPARMRPATSASCCTRSRSDPAMLEYLDNNRNRKGRPNENYAREVMELFTLGIGNYTEQDIKEAARSFTGWTFDRFGDEFRFNRRQHDFGHEDRARHESGQASNGN